MLLIVYQCFLMTLSLKATLQTTNKFYLNDSLRKTGVYKIMCEFMAVYIEQTGRTIIKHLEDHKRSLKLLYPDKSAVVQHTLDNRYHILF